MKISIRVIISVIIIIVSSSCSIDIELTNQNENIKINYIPKNIESEKNGLLGQLLLVKGEGFFLDSLSFYFDEKPTYAFLRNKDTLFVKIPRELNKIESTFKILIGIKDSLLYSSSFRLRKPKISSYSKNEVTFGESFWVYGNNFDNDNDYINTFFNDINIGNSYFDFDSLKVTHFYISISKKVVNSEYEQIHTDLFLFLGNAF